MVSNRFTRLFRRSMYFLSKFSTRMFFLAVGRLNVVGRDKVPLNGPLIVAANHRSYADPPLLGVAMPREVHFLAKKELFRFKPFGWLIRQLNAHPLDRAGDIAAFRIAQQILSAGYALIVFPEGKRMKVDQLGNAKPGVALLAKMAQCPIIPTYIHNAAHLARFRKVSVHFSDPINPSGFPDHETLVAEVMRQIQRMKDSVIAAETVGYSRR